MKKESLLTIIICVAATVLVSAGMNYVFSWSEPSSTMPSEYTVPINTSTTGQAKYGELSVTLLRDTDNQNYYLNPSSSTSINQFYAQNIQAGDNVCLDSGVCLSQIEEYVDNQLLVYGAHNFGDCTTAGGALVDDTDSSMKFCKFAASACPSSWTQYKSWATTIPTTCRSNYVTYGGGSNIYCSPCTTGSHSFANASSETCMYEAAQEGYYYTCGHLGSSAGRCSGSIQCTCTASYSEIGCY